MTFLRLASRCSSTIRDSLRRTARLETSTEEGLGLEALTAFLITTGVAGTGPCASSGSESKDAVLTID